jgi:hypothetical protein
MAVAGIPILLLTIPAGPHILAVGTPLVGVRTADAVLERHAGALPIDGHLAGSTCLDLVVEVSFDGGVTYPYSDVGHIPGGVIDDAGSPPVTLTQSIVGLSLPQPDNPNRRVRVRAVVPGAPVSVSGSASLS